MKAWMAVPALVIAVGCVAPKTTTADHGPQPTQADAEAAVLSWARATLKDPGSAQIESVRVSGIESGYNGLFGGGGWTHGWAIQFSCNARNGFGAYTGFKTYRLLWRDGRWYAKNIRMDTGGDLF